MRQPRDLERDLVVGERAGDLGRSRRWRLDRSSADGVELVAEAVRLEAPPRRALGPAESSCRSPDVAAAGAESVQELAALLILVRPARRHRSVV